MNRRKIIRYLLLLFLISRPYFFYRHFYIARGVPVTLWHNKIIIGQWYWKFSEPTKNYLEVPAFDVIRINFLDKTHFVVGDWFAGDSAQVIHNLDGYTCVEYMPLYSSGYADKYPFENSLVEYHFEWGWGRFFPAMRYVKDNMVYELNGVYAFHYWEFNKRRFDPEDPQR